MVTAFPEPNTHPFRPPPELSGWSDDRISFPTLLGVLRRRRKAVLIPGVLLAAAVAVFGLLRPRSYTAEAAFMSDSRRATSAASGIAAQLGVTLPGVDVSQSPQFYVDLVRSRPLLRSVVDESYALLAQRTRRTGNLADAFGLPESPLQIRREHAVTRLNGQIAVESSSKTGVVIVRVTTESPRLSFQISQAILNELDRFNLRRRQSAAAADRQFAEQRLSEMRGELRGAEDRLQEFMQGNRQFGGAPKLAFEQDRLQREVSMRQQVFTSLAQAYEQAKLDEVRDTPVLTIVEQPSVPVLPDPRGLFRATTEALLIGLLGGAMLAFWLAREEIRNSRSQ